MISFPFIFLGCIGCSNAGLISKMFYFIMFVVVFQFGWAATQISHLAMIPELTPSQDERTGLTAIRYSATVISNIAVYLLAWALLGKLMYSVANFYFRGCVNLAVAGGPLQPLHTPAQVSRTLLERNLLCKMQDTNST